MGDGWIGGFTRRVIRPDRGHRVSGTTYPSDRAPAGSVPLIGRAPSLREAVASLIVGASVRVVRPIEGDVLVVVGGDSLSEETRMGLVREARRRTGGVAVFLPNGCSVHAEPARLRSEDRGYREGRTYGADAVFTGVPEGSP